MSGGGIDLWTWTPGAAPRPAAPSEKIVEVIEVVDTREWVEGPDDRWYAIPGSGNPHECSRCRRTHEIHALVELESGARAIVGTGCAARESLEFAGAFRRGENRAKRVKELAARIAKQERLVAQDRAIRQEVSALTPPDREVVVLPQERFGGIRDAEVRVGDGKCLAKLSELSGLGLDERTRCALHFWRINRLRERGWTEAHELASGRLDELRKRLRLAQSKEGAR